MIQLERSIALDFQTNAGLKLKRPAPPSMLDATQHGIVAAPKKPRFALVPICDDDKDDGSSSDDSLDEILNFNPFADQESKQFSM